MQDVMDFESGQNEIVSQNKENQKKNEMKKQEQAKNMRLKCMEKLGETQEREGKGIKRKRTETITTQSNILMKKMKSYQKLKVESWS